MTTAELFKDIHFTKHLQANLNTVRLSDATNEKAKSNGMKSLMRKGLLNIDKLETCFDDIQNKKSKLPSQERYMINILVNDALQKTLKEKLENAKTETE